MSEVNSVAAALVASGRFVNRNTFMQPVKAVFDEYEAAALASGSSITSFTPPKGARWAGLGQLAWDDMAGAAATVAVGIAGDTDKFLAATDVQSAADKADLDAGAEAIDALGYEFDGETPIILTTGGGNAITGTLKWVMLFLMNS